MSNRFQEIYSSDKNLYTTGCPVVIQESVLLKDFVKDTRLVRLTLKNIQDREITDVYIAIQAKDITGNNIGSVVRHHYQDFQLHRDEAYGDRWAILMPDSKTASVTVTITEISFSNGEKWKSDQSDKYFAVTAPKQIFAEKNKKEYLKQYQKEVSADSKYISEDIEDLWYCSCGALNQSTEASCHKCGLEHDFLRNIDIDEIIRHCDERLLAKKKAREEAKRKEDARKAEIHKKSIERERQAKIESQKKREQAKQNAKKKTGIFARKYAPKILILFAVIVAGYLALTKYFIPKNHYDKASEHMEQKEYKQAVEIFKELDGFQDSNEKIEECKLEIVKSYMNNREYKSALKLIDSMQKNAQILDLRKEAMYNYATELFQQEKYSEASKYYGQCKKYEDADERAAFVKGIMEAKDNNHKVALDLFESMKSEEGDNLKMEYADLYVDALMHATKGYVLNSPKMSIDEALKYVSKVPYETDDELNALENVLSQAKKYSGTYVYKDKNGTYDLDLRYFITQGTLYASVDYAHYTGNLDDFGSVSIGKKGDKYPFKIAINGESSKSNRVQFFIIQVNAKSAIVSIDGKKEKCSR